MHQKNPFNSVEFSYQLHYSLYSCQNIRDFTIITNGFRVIDMS